MRIQMTATLLSALALAAPAVAVTAPHNMHAIHHRSPMASQLHKEQGDREVRALNRLEAAGYRHFGAVARNGSGFAMTANRHGRMFAVTITDNGVISASQI